MYSNKQIPQSLFDLKTNYNKEICLPVEVVSYVMEFLPYSDRIAAGQVCQLWYEASINYKFLNREKVVFNRIGLEDKSTAALQVIEKSCRPFLHFVFVELELSQKMRNFWERNSADIKSLSIQSCDITERMFIEILSNCKSLEHLDVNNCREPFISGRLLEDQNDIDRLKKTLLNVTKLSLSNNRYLSDALFNRLVSTMVNLSSLSIAGCQMSFHPGLYKKFYPNRLVSENSTFASETVLTFLYIMRFIQSNSNRLTCLDLSQTLVNSKSLSQIAELPDLHLKELFLQNCEQLSNAGILSVTQFQSSLIVLDLSGCSRVTDQSLINVCSRLLQLKKLSVCNCRAISDLGVVELRRLSKLEYIDLSQCEQVTGEGIESGLCSGSNSIMKQVHLRALNRLSVLTILTLTERLRNLLRLDLSYCFSAVTDRTVQSIFENLVWLRSLKLANCEAITDAGLTGMQMDCTEKVMVGASDCYDDNMSTSKNYISLRSKAEEDIVRDAKRKETVKLLCQTNKITGTQGYSLSSLRGLQELDLQSCNRITDVSLEYALKLKELQHLNLSRCQQITDVGLSFIAVNNPSIDTLNLSHCQNISDKGINSLAVSLRRLKYIDIQGCEKLTNASLSAFKANCPSLRYLDITHCKMTPDTVDMSSMAALQTLHMSATAY